MPAVLVVGGSGALGRAVVDTFKAKNWRTIVADVADNSVADSNVSLAGVPWPKQAEQIAASLAGTGVDAIVCTAGGWTGACACTSYCFSI